MDNIFNLQKESQNKLNDKKKLSDEHTKLAGKIEEENRKKAFEKVFNEAKITILGNEQPNNKTE